MKRKTRRVSFQCLHNVSYTHGDHRKVKVAWNSCHPQRTLASNIHTMSTFPFPVPFPILNSHVGLPHAQSLWQKDSFANTNLQSLALAIEELDGSFITNHLQNAAKVCIDATNCHVPAQKNMAKTGTCWIQKVECNPVIPISFGFVGCFLTNFQNAKQGTKPTIFRQPRVQQTKLFRWGALQIHQTTALETLPRKLLGKWKITNPFTPRSFWSFRFDGSGPRTQTAGIMSDGVCLKEANISSLRCFRSKSKT